MASGAVVRPLASISAAIGLKQVAKRSFTTAHQPLHQLRSTRFAVQIPKQRLRQSFRRGYADGPAVSAPVKKRRTWAFLRWTWRLTYLSAIGGFVYVGYGIYVNRNPADQHDPDPKKKTLVVLGMTSAMAPSMAFV